MKTVFATALALSTLMAGSAMAYTNILPGSGATVVGSSIHSGFDPAIAGGNLINGTSNPAYPNGDGRWVFADGNSDEETLTIDLGHAADVFSAGFVYSGQDRVPTAFSVYVSTDDVHFTLVAGPSAITDYGLPGLYDTEYSFTPHNVQYVRIDFGTDSFKSPDCGNCGGGIGEGAGIVQLQIYAVPEPATWALMLVGFAGLGAAVRARRQSLASAA